MESVARWQESDRRDLFAQTAANRGISLAIAEKDFWVCWTLSQLFACEELRTKIMFKGGTSLSKVFGLIDRFSEDIDLILDWKELTSEDPYADRSNRGKDRFREQIATASREYFQNQLQPELENLLGDLCSVTYTGEDTYSIDIAYPASFPDTYLRNQIRLDIQPFSGSTPNAIHEVQSYAAEEFPEQFRQPRCQVRAVDAERTFWDKVTILHREAHRRENDHIKDRQSRHYYDLARMAESKVKASALGNLDLLESVVKEKEMFFRQPWANFDLVCPGTVRLIPPTRVLREIEQDYVAMEDMFYGDVPPLARVLEVLRDLEEEINALGEPLS